MPSVVIGTAGHIDHGKTTLLRALTGIDADRLPEERARGMTIDVGYAHLDLADGSTLEFVDVPGHDRLVGNMLVGAGEIDAAMLVVAADDGLRAQTIEHLELLDALGVRDGVVVITKVDLVDADRLEAVRTLAADLIGRTAMAGAPILGASGETGAGIDELREALMALRDRVAARTLTRPAGPVRLAVDRAFVVKGRGSIVTGTLRGGAVPTGATLRLEPGGHAVRVREIQIHNAVVRAADGGRTAFNVAGPARPELHRGQVLTAGPGIETSDRLLVALRRPAMLGSAARPPVPGQGGGDRRWPPADGSRFTLHLGTAQVEARIGRRGEVAVELPDGKSIALVRLSEPVATLAGDRGVLRRPEAGEAVSGVKVLDAAPPRGVSRRRAGAERLAVLARAIGEADAEAAGDALIALHGALPAARLLAVSAALRAAGSEPGRPGLLGDRLVLAPDVISSLEEQARALVGGHHVADPVSRGLPAAELAQGLRLSLRRAVTIDRSMAGAAATAVAEVIDDLVARHVIGKAGDRFHDPSRADAPDALAAAMDRLEAALNVPAPPSLADAARAAGCPPEGVRAMTAAGRILRVEADLAWSAAEYQRLAAVALAMAARIALTPAAFRDATGTTRRYVVAILEDLDRRGLLRRTDDGHVLGPRAPRAGAAATPAGLGADR